MTLLYEVTAHCDRCGTDEGIEVVARIHAPTPTPEIRSVMRALGWDATNTRTHICPACVTLRAKSRADR